MHQSRSSPITFFFLMLPVGIGSGFVTVTLPFTMTRAGFSVATVASIVALGVSANVWNFVWGPVIDLTLTLRRWYGIGLAALAVSLLLLALLPLRQSGVRILTALVFLTMAGVATTGLPVGGLMAHTVADQKKGRAGGWSQAGLLGGTGLGGGAGVWLASHFSNALAGAAMFAVVLVCAATIYFVPDVRAAADQTLRQRLREIGRDFGQIIRSPSVLVTIVLVLAPIGVGAASNLWSAVAPGWRAEPNTVALVVGFLSGLVGVLGCVAGGWIADRVGRWRAFFGAGGLMALIAVIIAVAPRSPPAYASGVLCYAFSQGLAWAAFAAVVLLAIGRGAAATKFAILSSLGNVPLVYMTAFDGWVHDRSGVARMLEAEAFVAVACIAVLVLVLRKLKAAGRLEREPAPVLTG